MNTALVLVCGVILAWLAQVAWRRARRAQQAARQQLAQLQFAEQRDALAERFLAVAHSTGKPRGLRWKSCELTGQPLFAVDRTTGDLHALLSATISFEAVIGGGMEDVEAVNDLRAATAVFVYRQGQWTTDGRAVFNLEPHQVLERFAQTISQ